MDGVKYHDIESRPIVAEPLYYSASVEEQTGDILIKGVNVTDKARDAAIHVEGLTGGSGLAYRMCGWEPDSENELGKPEWIRPEESSFSISGSDFTCSFPERSVTVLRIRR